MSVDFGRTADDYARHRAGFPEPLFDRLAARGIGRPGQRAVDLGTGTGSLGRGLARRGAAVTGVDIAAPLVEQARALDRAAGISTQYVLAPAERTGLDAGAYDVVAAGPCWHWFDRAAAALEARRLLAPGGRLVIAHFDWIAYPGNVVEATEALIDRHNPRQPKPHVRFANGTGIYATWLLDAVMAGFVGVETFSFDLDVPYSHEAWRGRIRASQGVGAMLPDAEVTAFDAEHAAILQERFPASPLQVPHRVFAVVCSAPG
ncbi:MAG: class I SAM-dependent methyltransferase [Polyangiaceae bacterium]|nr:class I SAM-dependent methyltransferase [Polyangiaceae bacterium]